MASESDFDKEKQDLEQQFARLWRAWKTVHEMVQDRGYELADQEVNISSEDFQARFKGADGLPDRKLMRFSARPSSEMMVKYTEPATSETPNPVPDIGTIWIEFSTESPVGLKQMRAFSHFLTNGRHHTGILVTQAPITPAALKIIPAVAAEARIECFVEQELLFNITHHELVPQHVLLSKGEKLQVLERYKIKETQLLKIQVTDPVARYMGLRRGQIVKVIRVSETAGRYANYRLCW